MRRYLVLILALAVLFGCSPVAQPVATPVPPATLAAPSVATVEPSPVAAAATSAPAPTAVPPTTAPSPVPPTVAPTATRAPQGSGTAYFRDQSAHNDAIAIVMSKVDPPPGGMAYVGWLTETNGQAPLLAGTSPVAGDGSAQVTFAPGQKGGNGNLLNRWDGVMITFEAAQGTRTKPSGQVAFAGQLPPAALVHIRHVLLAFPDTPKNIGLGIGLLGQIGVIAQHMGFQLDTLNQQNLAGVKLHAEHLVNIIEGNQGDHYGDLNRDGAIQNPGDGFGLLENGNQKGYLAGTQQHATFAAQAADATDNVKQHAQKVSIATENIKGWVLDLDEREQEIAQAKSLAEATPLIRKAAGLVDEIVIGYDANGNETIEPIAGEAGSQTAYQEAQLMAAIPLVPRGPSAGPTIPVQTSAPVATQAPATTAPAPSATPVAPTATAVVPTSTAATVKVDIANFAFGAPLTIKVGTTVIWTNRDNAAHTVTADNGEFDSGSLKTGDTFSFTFSKPGTFPYYCAFHGGKGGVGMSSQVVVQP